MIVFPKLVISASSAGTSPFAMATALDFSSSCNFLRSLSLLKMSAMEASDSASFPSYFVFWLSENLDQ